MKTSLWFWILCCCVPAAIAAPLETLTILHINDTHSHIEADPASVVLSGQELYTDIGGMARLHTAVSNMRQYYKTQQIPTLLLHGGDAFKGSGYFEVHKSKVNSDLFNRVEVQAMALGNHEFDEGLQELATFGHDARFPLLAANVDTKEETSLAHLLQPYALFGMAQGQLQRITDVKHPEATIAVIGLALQDMPQIAPNTGHLKFLDEVSTAQRLINQLEQQGINKIVLLTHLGFERDLAIAKALDGVDVIVGGHSHSYLADLRAWNKGRDSRYASWVANKTRNSRACVVTAGQFTHLLGAVTLSFDTQGQLQRCAGEATLLSGDQLYRQPTRLKNDLVQDASFQKMLEQLPNTRVMTESPEIRTLIEQRYKPAVQARYGAKLTTAAQSLPHVRLPGTEGSDVHGSRVAPLVAQAMLDYVNRQDALAVLGKPVDFALVAAGGIRAGLEAGDVFEGQILMEVLPYETPLSVMTVKGAVIRALLQSTIAATLPVGAHAGKYPYGAGLRYQATEQQPGKLTFEQVEIYKQGQWQPLDDKASYRLVTTSYLANGNDGWQALAQPQRDGTDRVDLALMSGKLKAFPVSRLQETVTASATTYQPTFAGETLDCQHQTAALACGSQNEAFLQYLRHQSVLHSLPVTVTLQRQSQ